MTNRDAELFISLVEVRHEINQLRPVDSPKSLHPDTILRLAARLPLVRSYGFQKLAVFIDT